MSKHKILICDDEECIRESLNLILSDKYELIFAENGNEAIRIIKAAPDVKAVLLDIKMPVKNGFDVLRQIKAYNKDVPVIVVTGYQSVETAAEAIKEGAANYIMKPLDPKAVLQAVGKTLPW